MKTANLSHPVLGVGVLIWRNKQLLLGKRLLKGQAKNQEKNQHFCWQFPGGHLENDESVVECAQREVHEETGLKIKAMRHLGFTDRLFSVAGRQYITLFVSSEYESGEAQTLEPDKCGCWQWFDYQQLPMPLFEPILFFLAESGSDAGSSISPLDDLYARHEAAYVMKGTPSVGRK